MDKTENKNTGSKVAKGIIIAVLAVAVVGVLAYLFTDTDSQWYISLKKPSFQPSGTVFSISWAIIYLLLAASLALTIIYGNCKEPEVKKQYWYFAIMGVLNILWTLVFFIFHQFALSLLLLAAYLFFSILAIINAFKINNVAGWLLIPHSLWLTFALILNYITVLIN